MYKRIHSIVRRRYFDWIEKGEEISTRFTIRRMVLYVLVELFFRQTRLSEIRRWIRANNRATTFESIDHSTLPEIDILVCSAEKDLDFLPYVIQYAIQNSKNPINKVIVVVPTPCLNNVQSKFMNMSNIKFQLVAEEDLIDESIRGDLKHIFKHRYGWVLQQYLTLQVVLTSHADGVLQINADTLLLKPQTWLTANGLQVLFETNYYHKQYYENLQALGMEISNRPMTFISHHMLFQPKLLLDIFHYLKLNSLDELHKRVISCLNLKGESPFCLEYELYAQGALLLHRDQIKLLKFSNVSRQLIRDNPFVFPSTEVAKCKKRFNSVSFHTYLSTAD